MNGEEIRKYARLNELAEQGGIVIFGCGEDRMIPTCELRQAFSLETNIYNRSFDHLSIDDALTVYQQTVSPIDPDTVFLHIGEADRDSFAKAPQEFDRKYHELIDSIRSQNKKCRIVVVALKNYDRDPAIEEINRHLKYIADSERCEYGDIAARKVWNPKATMDAASFVHSIGFPFKVERPLYDLVKILFCCEG